MPSAISPLTQGPKRPLLNVSLSQVLITDRQTRGSDGEGNDLPLPTSAKAWTLGGFALGVLFGMQFTQWIDLAEEVLRGAIDFGIAGAVAGLNLRWVAMRILRR